MANKSNTYYRALETSWGRELENELLFLEVVHESKILTPKVTKMLIKRCKNKIKRCRWNITRAINLRKKANGT